MLGYGVVAFSAVEQFLVFCKLELPNKVFYKTKFATKKYVSCALTSIIMPCLHEAKKFRTQIVFRSFDVRKKFFIVRSTLITKKQKKKNARRTKFVTLRVNRALNVHLELVTATYYWNTLKRNQLVFSPKMLLLLTCIYNANWYTRLEIKLMYKWAI